MSIWWINSKLLFILAWCVCIFLMSIFQAMHHCLYSKLSVFLALHHCLYSELSVFQGNTCLYSKLSAFQGNACLFIIKTVHIPGDVCVFFMRKRSCWRYYLNRTHILHFRYIVSHPQPWFNVNYCSKAHHVHFEVASWILEKKNYRSQHKSILTPTFCSPVEA